MVHATLNLGPSLETALASGHPWMYRNHLPPHRLRDGDWVRLEAGRRAAYGVYDAEGAIAVRIFSTTGELDDEGVRARVDEALALRRPLAEQGHDAYRLLYGEGDYLPGITVDRYGRFAVVRTYATGVRRLLPAVAQALAANLRLKGVVERTEDGLTPLWGELPPPRETVCEHGLRFAVDLYHGQKTGLFLDHREGRRLVRGVAAGRTVLNLFAYTGGFSVYALAGGASSALSVDVAGDALEQADANVALNGLPSSSHSTLVADVFDLLPRLAEGRDRYDLVVLDPPSLARNAGQRRRALRAYQRLNRAALRLVTPGGLLATASCTAQVSPEAFREAVAAAAREAGVRAQIVGEHGQPRDHPVPTSFPEGRYLKFLLLRVLPG